MFTACPTSPLKAKGGAVKTVGIKPPLRIKISREQALDI